MRGGTLDVCASTAVVDAAVLDVGLSDHLAIRWRSAQPSSPAPSVVAAAPVLVRPWRRLDMEKFRSAVSESRLCRPDLWPADVDELCSVYNTDLNQILDRLVPRCSQSVKRRPTDPWFDAECRQAKRTTRRLERAYSTANRRLSAASPATSGYLVAAADAAAAAAWYSQRRDYRTLRRRKCQDL